MQDLKYWKNKIKEKRKQTSFRDFLMDIASWYSLVLYKNSGMISKFPETDRIGKVVSFIDFENSRDDLLKKGLDYDFNKNFFSNYSRLFKQTDIFNLINYGGNENSDFADMIIDSRSIYLSSVVINSCENVAYSMSVKDNCTNVLDSLAIWDNSENIYSCVSVVNSYKVFYSKFINNGNNIWFSTNLTGCSECIACSDLDNCSYYIENISYKKEEYFKKKALFLKDKNKFQDYYLGLDKVGKNVASTNITGNSFFNSENIENGYFGYNIKNGKNLILVGGVDGNEDMYDVFPGGAPTARDFYGVMGANGDNIYCSMNITISSNMFYSYNCKDSSFCLGCIGLQNKSYCIFNKQYTKQEWEILADKIFLQMEKDGVLGDFFPGNINPFYFNDTIAGLIGGFTKGEVEKKGYMWRDKEIKVDIPEGVKTINIDDLNSYQGYNKDGNWKIKPEILDVAIKDKKGNYYKIVQMEYDFLLKYGLPLPEIHWMDRVKINFGM